MAHATPSGNSPWSREHNVADESKTESRNSRDGLTESALDGVTGGANGKYDRLMEMMSKVLQSAADIRKSIVANIR
jgi:hypothetical protein